MLTVKQILQSAARKLKLKPPSTFIGGNTTAEALLASFDLCGNLLAKEYSWAVLERKHTITLVEGQTAYALPQDYDRQLKGTAWNTSNKSRALLGVTPFEFSALENSTGGVPGFDAARTFGWVDNQINLYTAPSAGDAGQEIEFYYISNRWMRPQSWVAGGSVSSGGYVWHNGKVYQAGASGLMGSTAPTHTSGGVSDGSIVFTYIQDHGWAKVVEDTDVPLLDDMSLLLGVIVDFGESEGFDVSAYRVERDKRLAQVKSDLSGADVIRSFGRYRDIANFPETGFSGY